MKLNEVFSSWAVGSLFSIYLQQYPTETYIPSNCDILYFAFHSGEKTASPFVETMMEKFPETYVTEIVKSLYSLYGESWSRMADTLFSEYKPIENYSMIETETPNLTETLTPNTTTNRNASHKHKTTETNTGNGDNSIYGFNSSTAVPTMEANTSQTVINEALENDNSDSESVTTTGTETKTNTGTRTLTRSGNIGVTTSQQMIESELELRKKIFLNYVFDQTDSLLALTIY